MDGQRWSGVKVDLVRAQPSPHGRLVGTGEPLEQPERHRESPGRPARHLAPDGPARIDGLDIAGQHDFASDEAVRIAEGRALCRLVRLMA
jgi:hypothetical protein